CPEIKRTLSGANTNQTRPFMVVAVIVVTVGVVVSVWGGSGVVMVIMMVARGWCHGDDVRMVVVFVEAREYGDRVDQSGGSVFGICQKSHRKSFPMAGERRRWWLRGGGGGRIN
ncbi:hypothetical protein Tco_1520954, partial [Tanacetum coccineum]